MTEVPTSRPTHSGPLSLLWRILAAPQTLLVLLGLIALALGLAAFIPQIPPEAAEDPQAWLAVQPAILGQNGGLLYALGLFDIYHAFWFHMLLVLAGLTLFVWFVESADLAWRATGDGRWTSAALAVWGRHPLRMRVSSSRSPPDVLAQLLDFLTHEGYTWADVPDLPDPNLVAGRRTLFLWAQPVVYGALLLVLVSLAIVGYWGWQSSDWQPDPANSLLVGYGIPYTLRLDAFEMQRDGTRGVGEYRSELVWLENGVELSRDVVSAGRPAVFQGVAVRQVGFVPVARVRAWDASGRPLAVQVEGEEPNVLGEAEVTFPMEGARQLVLFPGRDLFLALSSEPLCAEDRPALHVALLDGAGAEQSVAVLHESDAVTTDDLQLEVDLAYRPILRVDQLPGMAVAVGGAFLAVIALIVSWLGSPRLLWIAVAPDSENTSLVQILALPSAKGSRWPWQFGAQLQEVLESDA